MVVRAWFSFISIGVGVGCMCVCMCAVFAFILALSFILHAYWMSMCSKQINGSRHVWNGRSTFKSKAERFLLFFMFFVSIFLSFLSLCCCRCCFFVSTTRKNIYIYICEHTIVFQTFHCIHFALLCFAFLVNFERNGFMNAETSWIRVHTLMMGPLSRLASHCAL